MQILELLAALEDYLMGSKDLMFTKKIMVNRDELLDIVDDIKRSLPEEIKQAKWIKEERARIMQEAKKEAEDIVKEAERRIIEMVDEHEITRQAEEKSLKMIEDAKMQSREISEGTKEYADAKLGDAERAVYEIVSKIQAQEDMLQGILERLKEDRRGLKR